MHFKEIFPVQNNINTVPAVNTVILNVNTDKIQLKFTLFYFMKS